MLKISGPAKDSTCSVLDAFMRVLAIKRRSNRGPDRCFQDGRCSVLPAAARFGLCDARLAGTFRAAPGEFTDGGPCRYRLGSAEARA